MSTGRVTYAAAATITITLNNLASGSARQSASINNTSNRYVDGIIYMAIGLVAGSPTGDQRINVYGYGGTDTAKLTDNASGSDAAITLRSPGNLQLLGRIETPDSGALTYKGVFASAAIGLAGMLPPYWGLAIENQTGLALAASGHVVEFVGIHSDIT